MIGQICNNAKDPGEEEHSSPSKKQRMLPEESLQALMLQSPIVSAAMKKIALSAKMQYTDDEKKNVLRLYDAVVEKNNGENEQDNEVGI